MCGIAGLAGTTPADGRATVERMVEALAHRGPDHRAVRVGHDADLPVALGYTRLSIVDLSSAGNQPMTNETGDVWLVYNGELYNHAELRRELEVRGHRYRSRADTETIVHAYEEWGVDAFSRLDGMFALAIHDERAGTLLLARDRRGIKPLYYRWDGARLAFASELKALAAGDLVPRAVDPTALWLYLCLGYVPSPFSLLDGVCKLEPGHVLVFRGGSLRSTKYVPDVSPIDRPSSEDELVDRVRRAVEAAVSKQLMSDVPVGVFLSGGLDSSIVAALAARSRPGEIHTFSASYGQAEGGRPIDGQYLEDAVAARTVARELGTQHHEVEISNRSDLRPQFAELVVQLDEPMVEPVFVTTDHLASLARRSGVPVVLTGDGADELFGGYDRYFAARRLARYRRLPWLPAILPAVEALGSRLGMDRNARELRYLLLHPSNVDAYIRFSTIYRPDQALALLAPDLRREVSVEALAELVRIALPKGRPFVDQMAQADLSLWVGEHFNPRLDRITMRHSVEARVPFQDDSVVALALATPSAAKSAPRARKRLLSKAFSDLVPRIALERRKRSYQAPGHAWLESGLAAGTRRLTDRPESLGHLFDPELVRGYAATWGAGTPGDVFAVSALLIAGLWADSYLDPAPEGEVSHGARTGVA